MAKDDFFLSFGTDADVFASKIESESSRATESIYNLAQALQDYDRTLENTKRGGPLNSLFGALDEAAGKFGSLTHELVGGMESALRGVGELTSELAGLVDAVNKINELRPQSKRRVQTAVSEVTDEEVIATDGARRSGKALGEIIELNATQARNALKRVADINATVGRNSNSAADGLKELAKQIRELSGAAKEAKGRGTVGQIANTAGHQIIVVQGGTVQAGEGSQINVADVLAQAAANTPKPAERPLTDQQADAQVRAEAKRRRNDPEPLADLAGPARSGLYSYPGLSENGRRGGRLVGADVRENESFGDYFARNDATRARIEESRAALPKPHHEDLADFNQFKLSGGKAKDFASGLETTFKRALQQDKTASAITAESIRASLTDLGLEQQYPKLPEIIARVFKVRAEQRIAAEKTIRELIAEDPAVSFGGGAFGTQNSDFEVGNTFPAALAKVDEDLINTHEGDPETVRLAQRRRQAQEDRKLLRSRPRPFDNAVDPGTLVGDVGTPEQEGLTLAARRKQDIKARREARLRNKELVASLDAIDPESVRARRQGNPELQRINAALSKKSLSTGDIAEALGLSSVTTRQPASNEDAFFKAHEDRERAETRLQAFDTDPEQYTAREKARQAAKAETFRNFDSPGSELVARDAQRRATNLTPEAFRAEIVSSIAEAAKAVRATTSRTDVQGLTDDSERRAREVLSARRAEILNQTATSPKSTIEEVEQNVTRRTGGRGTQAPGRRVIYRGESPDAGSASNAESGKNLQGRFFTENLEQAREYAGPNGRVVSTTVSEKTLQRARNRAIQEKVLEGLVVSEAVAKSAGEFDPAALNPETSRNNPRSARRPSRKGALQEARATAARIKEELAAEGADIDSLNGALAAAEAEIARLSAARSPKAAAGGAGGGQPPRTPPNAGAAGHPDPDDRSGSGDVFGQDPSKSKNRSRAGIFERDYAAQIQLLSAETRAELENAKARLVNTQSIANETERLEAQRRILVEAGAALKNDAHFKNFPNLETARGTFAQAVGLPPSKSNYNTVRELFTQGGAVDSSGLVNKARQAAESPSTVPGAQGEVGTLGKALFGQRGFLDAQLRHIGLAIENFAGFQLVFTGFEKFKELVETGLETEVTFVRLKATLDATGRSANGLRSAFSRISTETGEDLKKVVQAGAELAGVFQNNADLVHGVEVAAQLANISQGTLTAKEAAIGLRDVTDAYAVSGAQGIQQVGDQIARLSVVTGVSVKDITEGATQLAQEAHEFGLSQRQAVTLTAFVTKSTGESGEQAAEQTSRLLSTLTTTKVQDVLVKFNVATREQFAGGDIAGVITNLIDKFDELSPSARQAIQSLVGAGRQARAFTGLVRDGSEIIDEFNNSQNDLGTLANQNQAILGTVSGNIKQLGEEFRNLGQTLQQLGVFDILGVVAKSVQLLLHEFNRLGQGLADIFNSNPITRNFKDLVAIILEATLAFKILGPIASATMAKLGLGAAGRAATAAAAEAAAVAKGVPYVPAAAPAPGRVRRFFAPPTELSPASNVVTGRQGFVNPAGQFVTGGVRPLAPLGAVGRGLGGVATGLDRAAGRELGVLSGAAARAAAATRGLSNGLQNLGQTMVATGAESKKASIQAGAMNGALIGLAIAIPLVIKGFQEESEARKRVQATIDDLTGASANKGDEDDPAKKAENEARAEASKPGSYAKAYKDFVTGGPSGTSKTQRLKNILGFGDGGAGSGGVTSDKFDEAEGKLTRESFEKLRAAKTPEELKQAQFEVNEALKNQSKQLIESAGDVDAQKSAAADLEVLKTALNKAGDHRLQTLQGLNSLDILNIKNIEGIGTLVATTQSLTRQTLGQIGPLLAALESDTGLKTGSATDKNFQTSIDPAAATDVRRRANIANLKESLRQGQDTLENNELYKAPGAAREALKTTLTSQANTLGQLEQAELQNAQAVGSAKADFLGKVGNPAAAADAMKESVTGILDVLRQLDASQPEYWAALNQLLDAQLKSAELASTPATNKTKIAASLTNNSVTKANADKSLADQALADAKSAVAAAGPQVVDAAQSGVDKAQADVDRITGESEGADASDRKFFNEALTTAQDKLKAAQATLAAAQTEASTTDNPAVVAAQIAANQAALTAAQAKADDALAANQLASAILGAAGNTAAASLSILEGLQGKTGTGGALAAAIANYGTKSAQANAIRIQIIQQKAQHENDLLDILNADLDLEIATLDARGASGDAEAAAKDRTEQAQNSIDSYKKRTGDTGLKNPEGKRLQAALITAKRSQFDTALQAQLETLDFQKETYQITSNQEIAALQQILKNKELTLKEQRDITLKIKNLQEQIRQQLTSSGFNIPSDIKLPTAYAVRRSLGQNPYDTKGTTATNYSTNVTNQTTVNNTVSSPAMVDAVAKAVVNLINTQTSTAARSNQTSPALVQY